MEWTMSIENRIKGMKEKLVSPEEIAEQKGMIEFSLEKIRKDVHEGEYYSGTRDLAVYVAESAIDGKDKLSYFKEMIPYMGTEGELFKVSSSIIEVAQNNPELRQEMFDTLKEFVKYPKVYNDNGSPLSAMYNTLYNSNLYGSLKDNPNFAANFLEVMKSEMQAERYQKNGFYNLDRAWQYLDKVVSDYPESTALAYDVYKDVQSVGKERTYNDTSLKEARLCQKMIEQLEQDGKNTDNVEKLKNRKKELEEQCWKYTHDGVLINKNRMATYVETFPEHADKAFDKARRMVFNGNDREDVNLRMAFRSVAEKNPQFAETWNKCKMEHVTRQAAANTQKQI